MLEKIVIIVGTFGTFGTCTSDGCRAGHAVLALSGALHNLLV